MSNATARFATLRPQPAGGARASRRQVPAKGLILIPWDFSLAVHRRCAKTRDRVWFATCRRTQISRVAGDLPAQTVQKLAAARKLLA